jgi:hypothetical protein
MYSQDVVFIEVEGNSEPEEGIHTKNNPDTVQFEQRNEEYDSNESIESKEEVKQHNPVVRRSKRVRKSFERYSPPEFHSTFVLTAIDDDPKSIDEVVELAKGKLWKDSMVKEMESLHKNETWYLVQLPSGRNTIDRKWVL